jgi:hypothetical protein
MMALIPIQSLINKSSSAFPRSCHSQIRLNGRLPSTFSPTSSFRRLQNTICRPTPCPSSYFDDDLDGILVKLPADIELRHIRQLTDTTFSNPQTFHRCSSSIGTTSNLNL